MGVKTKLPAKWRRSEKSIRAVQVAFEFSRAVSNTIREEAKKQGLSPSDQIRLILGLEVKKPKRPRLTVSLSGQDYRLLAERFGIAVDDKEAIRLAIRETLITYGEAKGDGS